jgi:hypothetical protein
VRVGGQGLIGRQPEPADRSCAGVLTPQLHPGIALGLLAARPRRLRVVPGRTG